MIRSLQKKAFFFVLTACVALAAFFVQASVFTDHEHDCMGEDCPVCLYVEASQNLLKSAVPVISGGPFADISTGPEQFLKRFDSVSFFPLTPVSLKVRFNS